MMTLRSWLLGFSCSLLLSACGSGDESNGGCLEFVGGELYACVEPTGIFAHMSAESCEEDEGHRWRSSGCPSAGSLGYCESAFGRFYTYAASGETEAQAKQSCALLPESRWRSSGRGGGGGGGPGGDGGPGGGGGDFGEVFGACFLTVDGGRPLLCTEYPDHPGFHMMEGVCGETEGAEWLPSCPSEGAYGKCVLGGVVPIQYHYDGAEGLDEDYYRENCEEVSGGTWEKL